MKWEYLVVDLGQKYYSWEHQDILKRYGQEKWELVTIVITEAYITAYFKRELYDTVKLG